MDSNSVWGIALVGCGTVGGGTASILVQNQAQLSQKTGTQFLLKAIVDVNYHHARSLGLAESLFRPNLDEVLQDPTIQIVVELAGGTGFARTVAQKVLQAGKHLVTANKALLATYGPELFRLARAKNLAIGYEASCVGGVPIVRVLAENLIANDIQALYGIVNGTCNYILTQQSQNNLDYATALKQAQQLGYAEADPTLDVSGMDSAHKMSLLASLAMGRWVDFSQITVRGLDTVPADALASAAQLHAAVKLLGKAEQTEQGLSVSIAPTMIPLSHPLARLEGSFNGVSVYGSEVGHLYFQGRGAGAHPTASAVVADIVGIAAGTLITTQNQYGFWPDQIPAATLANPQSQKTAWSIQAPAQQAESLQQALNKASIMIQQTVIGEKLVSIVVENCSESELKTTLTGSAVSLMPWFSGREG